MFTSVPMAKVVVSIRRKLEADDTLLERTNMSPAAIRTLLDGLLAELQCFVLHRQFYRQIHGTVIVSPVSMIVCNVQMEDLEELAISMVLNPHIGDTTTRMTHTPR